MKRRLLLSAVLAIFLSPPEATRAELTFIAHYVEGDAYLDIVISDEGGEKQALLGISQKTAILFTKYKWSNFVAAWAQAKLAKTDEYEVIDYFSQGEPPNNSMLIIGAGPAVRFTIVSKAVIHLFIIRPKDYSKFDVDIAKVSALLGSN
jgi:hypothetical protein